MPATCSLLTKLVNVFKLSMSHYFNVISTCRPDEHCVAANVSQRVTIAVQHVLRVCSAGAVGQLRWSLSGMTGWFLALTERCEKTRGTLRWKCWLAFISTNTWRTALAELKRSSRFRRKVRQTEWSFKEGSGFPCASALFLGDWNVLQELPHSVMALPPGTVQVCLTCS